MPAALQLMFVIVSLAAMSVAYRQLAAGRVDVRRLVHGSRRVFDRARRLAIARPSRPASILADEPVRSSVSLSLFESVADPRFARAMDGAIVVSECEFVAVGSPKVAETVDAHRSFFSDDVTGLLHLNRASRNLLIDAPIQIVGVIADRSVADEAPFLLPRAAARAHQLKLSKRTAPPRTAKLERAGEPRHDPGDIAATLVPTVGGRPIAVSVHGQKLGRGPQNGAGAIDVITVSWDHAAIEPSEHGLQISDLKSTHGTRVNGEPIGAHVLRAGDRVALGPDAEYLWVTSTAPPSTGT